MINTTRYVNEDRTIVLEGASHTEAPLADRGLVARPRRAHRRARGLATHLVRKLIVLDAMMLLPMFLIVSLQAPIGMINPLLIAAAAAATVTGAARRMGAYTVAAADSPAVAWKRSLAAVGVSIGLFLLVTYATAIVHDRSWLPLATAGAVSVLSLHRAVLFGLGLHPKTLSHVSTRLALLGDADAIAEFENLEPKDSRRVIVERMELETYDDIRPALRQVDQLLALESSGVIDRIVVLAAAPGIPVVNAIVRRCSMHGVGVDLLTGATRVRPSRMEIGRVLGFSTVHIRPGLSGKGRLAAKRVLDLIIASLALIAFAPLVAVTAVAVKIGSPGSVFYKQRRLGRSGEQFEMIKFRSMLTDADQMVVDLTDQNEADGPLFKMKDDPRVTRVGKFIRRTSIDELPQLWNVLRGEMSLVGPRPALAHEADGWPIELFDRLEVAPGITGLWQVSGRSDASFADYERLDLYYVDNWTIGLDLAILARTIPAVFGRGAY